MRKGGLKPWANTEKKYTQSAKEGESHRLTLPPKWGCLWEPLWTSSAADVFLSILSPLMGQNAMGTAMAGANALSSAAQTQASAEGQNAYAQYQGLQDILGPLGSLVGEWATKDQQSRMDAKLAELTAKSSFSTNGNGSGNLGGTAWTFPTIPTTFVPGVSGSPGYTRKF